MASRSHCPPHKVTLPRHPLGVVLPSLPLGVKLLSFPRRFAPPTLPLGVVRPSLPLRVMLPLPCQRLATLSIEPYGCGGKLVSKEFCAELNKYDNFCAAVPHRPGFRV